MSNNKDNIHIPQNAGNQANIKKELDDLSKKIENFSKQQKEENNKIGLKSPKNPHLAFVYNIFADLLGGVITAFILNKIYCHFFEKNNLVFAILLLCCVIAGLYNTIRILMKKGK